MDFDLWPEVPIQVLTIKKRRSTVWCGTRGPVMRCRRCIAGSVKDKASVVNGGHHGYSGETLFQSTAERMKPKTRRRDKTWHGVTFCETCSPFQMGAKTWNIDGSPLVKNRAGVNPITMNCKMNECYSADPQKSLRWPNWVTWWLMQHIVHVQITRKSKGHCPSTYSLSLLNLLLAIMCGRSNCRCNANSITMDCKRNECYSADPQNVITLAKLGNLINAKLWSNQTKTKRPLPF